MENIENHSKQANFKTESSQVHGKTYFDLLTPSCGKIMGQEKYLGGTFSKIDSAVYFVPGHAKRVLRYHLPTGTLSYHTPKSGLMDGKYKWLRGVTAKDGCIYCKHYKSSNSVLLRTNKLNIILPVRTKWLGGATDSQTVCQWTSLQNRRVKTT